MAERKIYATKRQSEFLESVGIPHEKGRTRDQASLLIEQYIQGQPPRNLPSTEKQIDFIEQLGGVANKRMTRDQASQFIELLLEDRVRCNKCNSSYDQRYNRCSCGSFVPKLAAVRPPRWIYEGESMATASEQLAELECDHKPSFWDQVMSWFG